MWPKLHTLEVLRANSSRLFNALPFCVLGVEDWATKSAALLRSILNSQLGPVLAVRSCASMEDAMAREPPGFFDSVLDVRANAKDLRQAIEKVAASYARRPTVNGVPNKIIIQQQLLTPKLCGVCWVGATENDYIEIDFDDTLGRTDSVTAGVKAKRAVLSPCLDELPDHWLGVRRCADELRKHFQAPFFIEFALDAGGVPTVFQVRPDRRLKLLLHEELPPSCEHLASAAGVVEAFGPLSVMADWNPAEILGLNPMPLDVSLYDELVMQGAWAEGRASIGWSTPSDRNLMVTVAGRPYVKIVHSLQSLLPKDLPLPLAKRLVQDRLAVLSSERQLHDKVEFRLMWSAFAFDEEAVESDLLGRRFSRKEVQQLFGALKKVTRETIESAPRLLESDRAGVSSLEAQRRALAQKNALVSPTKAAKTIRKAIDICRTNGTVPFSRQARLAFTFRYIINHLLERGEVDAAELARWQSQLNTVTRQFSRDLARVHSGKLSQEAFLARYGHLRPSTYDLESMRYDERTLPTSEDSDARPGRSVILKKSPRLGHILSMLGTKCTQSEFWSAAAGAFKGREELKFRFTALLSDILNGLAKIAEAAGLKRSDLRRVPLKSLLAMMDQAASWHDFGRLVVASSEYQASPKPRLRLPDIIFGAVDLHFISEPDIRPTFVGTHSASGAPSVVHKESSAEPGTLSGAIVVIETADPGYDWVFAHRLGGLVTAYGGEFSHMGLRCGEFGVPAVIGCGPSLFASAAKATNLKLAPSAGELWVDGRRLFPA